MRCLHENSQQTAKCRQQSKDYLQCRMDKYVFNTYESFFDQYCILFFTYCFLYYFLNYVYNVTYYLQYFLFYILHNCGDDADDDQTWSQGQSL